MIDASKVDPIQQLHGVLDRERAALLSGDISALEGLLKEKEALIESGLDLSEVDAGRIPEIHDKALRNKELIECAMQGIRDVATRLGTLDRLRRSLEIYDREGRRTRLNADFPQRVQRRA